jgi:hypothetical protein
MANEKISELPAGAPALPSDEIPIARAGQNYALGVSDVNALVPTVDLRISGNTAGVTSLISSGTAVFAGGNNITLSQQGQSITVIGAAGGGGGGGNFSGGLSNIGNTSGNTGITGTQLVLAGGNNITLSQATGPNGATVTISGGTLGGGGGVDVTLGGNTAGVLSLVSSGTLFLAGGNNVTLSQNGNSVTISANTVAAANLSVSAGTTTGAFGGITFSNSNNISFGLNNGTVTATASQSVQTDGIYFLGQTTGQSSSSTHDARSLSISVGGDISMGWSNGSLLISNASGNFDGAGISTGGNTLGITGVQSQQLVFVGGSNITLSGSAAGGSGTISIIASNQTLGLYASSQTYAQSSSSTFDARSLSIVGSGNITVGMSAGSLLISGGAAAGAGGSIYAAGNTTGQSSSSSFAISSLNISAAGILSGGWSSNTFIISAPASTGLTQSMYATSNTTQSSSGTQSIGSLLFAGAGNVSVGVSNGSVVISGAGGGGGGVNFGVSTGGNTAGSTGTVSTGNVVLVGAGPISLSQSTGAAGSAATITINAPATSSLSATGNASISAVGSTISIGANAAAITIGGNSTSAGAGYSNVSSGTAFFAGGNNITLSQNGASITISGGAGGGAAAALSIGGNSTSAGAGYSNITSGTAILLGGNNITLSQNGASITISGANVGGAQTGISGLMVSNTTYTSGTVSFSNANGISFGSSAGQAITASYTVPSTAGLISAFKVSGGGSSVNATAVTFSNSNNVTFGLSTGASVGTMTASYALNVSAVGGTSNALSGLTFTNSGGVSFGLSTGAGVGTLSAAVATTAAYYFLGNTTGASSSSTAGDQSLSINASGGVSAGWTNGSWLVSAPATSSLSATGWASLSVNGSTISIGAAAPQLSFFQPLGPIQNTTLTQNGIGSIQVYPAIAAFPFSASRADIMVSASAAVLALSTQAQTVSMYIGLYSLNGSTLSLASSGSQSYAMINSSNNSNASIVGLRRFSAPINVNYTGGFDLFVGIMSNTTFVNTNGISFSNVAVPVAPGAQLQGFIGQSASNSMQFVPGQGFFSTTSAGMPSSMALSAISGIGSTSNNAFAAPVQFVNLTA